jgi:hypothetical protein
MELAGNRVKWEFWPHRFARGGSNKLVAKIRASAIQDTWLNLPVTEQVLFPSSREVSAGGGCVELQAEMDLICLISNCPQFNNPCNVCNPTRVQCLIWD